MPINNEKFYKVLLITSNLRKIVEILIKIMVYLARSPYSVNIPLIYLLDKNPCFLLLTLDKVKINNYE